MIAGEDFPCSIYALEHAGPQKQSGFITLYQFVGAQLAFL